MFGRDRKCHRFGPARGKRDSFESLQLLNRPGDRTDFVANIHLNHLVPADPARVCDRYSDDSRFVPLDRRLCEARFAEFKGGIAEAEAKRIERTYVIEKISAPRRRLVIVIRGKMADRPWEW